MFHGGTESGTEHYDGQIYRLCILRVIIFSVRVFATRYRYRTLYSVNSRRTRLPTLGVLQTFRLRAYLGDHFSRWYDYLGMSVHRFAMRAIQGCTTNNRGDKFSAVAGGKYANQAVRTAPCCRYSRRRQHRQWAQNAIVDMVPHKHIGTNQVRVDIGSYHRFPFNGHSAETNRMAIRNNDKPPVGVRVACHWNIAVSSCCFFCSSIHRAWNILRMPSPQVFAFSCGEHRQNNGSLQNDALGGWVAVDSRCRKFDHRPCLRTLVVTSHFVACAHFAPFSACCLIYVFILPIGRTLLCLHFFLGDLRLNHDS